MEALIAFGLIYFAIVIFIAVLKALGRTGSKIVNDWPYFMEKVFYSAIVGLSAGVLVTVLTGGSSEFVTQTAIVAGLAKFGYDTFIS